MTRDDERKLYEAYKVLDKCINTKLNVLREEEIDFIFDELKKELRHIVYEISTIKSSYKRLSDLQYDLEKYLDDLKMKIK